MNLLLIESEKINSDGTYIVCDSEKLKHIHEIIKPEIGKELKTGIINGEIVKAKIIDIKNTGTSNKQKNIHEIILQISLNEPHLPPPLPIPVTLIIAMQRPKTLKKILQNATSMGVKKFYIIEAWKVEKGYWTSSILENSTIEKNLLLGLEQCGDTILPKVFIRKKFKPFVEDELPDISRQSMSLVAHPYAEGSLPKFVNKNITLAIGPEGGFTDYEIDKFENIGFLPVNIGDRILRSEYAVAAILAKLF